MMVGSGRAAALGIFVRGGDVLERLAKVDRVAFDKTGTLTEHRAEVAAVIAVPGATTPEVLSLAASVEADSDHPIALAIRAAVTSGELEWRPASARSPGSGVVGTLDGHRVEVGRPEVRPGSPSPSRARSPRANNVARRWWRSGSTTRWSARCRSPRHSGPRRRRRGSGCRRWVSSRSC